MAWTEVTQHDDMSPLSEGSATNAPIESRAPVGRVPSSSRWASHANEDARGLPLGGISSFTSLPRFVCSSMLFGRDAECLALDALLSRPSEGSSGVLLVRGGPGMGKTALLQHARTVAASMTVVAATGVESESELPYSSLHQLLHPLFAHLPALPDLQRRALEGALGFAAPRGADRLVIGAAVLTLLGEAAGEGGLACIVDDVQWCDRASVHAMLFAFRRMRSEGVAVLLGTRPIGDDSALYHGLETLDLEGLDEDAAGNLLQERSGAVPAKAVVIRLTALTRGHPLALVEIARLLPARQLQGRAPLPDPLPMSTDLQRSYLEQVRRLTPAAQLALVVAALDDTGRMMVLLSAFNQLGLDDEVVLEAEESGLLVVGPSQQVSFVHPLVRTAVAASAGAAERRNVHQALARALASPAEKDRRIWHAAAAVIGADDSVAEDLEESARTSMARGAPAAAAAALQRAAELSSDVMVSANRYVAAGRAAWIAGQVELAHSALDRATSQSSDRLLLGEVADLRGLLQWRQGDAAQAHAIFMAAAPTVSQDHPAMALRMLVSAVEAASWFGSTTGLVAAGRLANEVMPGTDADARLYQDYAVGLAALLTGDSAEAGRRLVNVTAAAQHRREPEWLVWAAKAAMFLGWVEESAAFAQQATDTARVSGQTATLVSALEMLTLLEHTRGHEDAAQVAATEGLQLALSTGHTSSAALFWADLAGLAAQRGDENACVAAAEQAWTLARPRRLGLATAAATHAVAQLEMMQGKSARAFRRLVELVSAGPGEGSPSISIATLGDLVELAVRLGERAEAVAALARLERWVEATDSSRGRSLVLRCRALLAQDGAADLFAAALAAHPEGEAPLELARTRLLYGQWLRRDRRHSEARPHLHAALLTFERLSCRLLADTAREELRAAGGAVEQPRTPRIEHLTGQELTIARLVSEGSSTKDVAARLFLSPRTVEYHLHKVYPKLGVRSRTELASVLARQGG